VYFLGRAVLRPLFWLLFRTRRVDHRDIPGTGPVLIASNHLNAWDTVLIPVAAVRPVQFLTKSSFFEKSGLLGSFLRWFFTNIGAVPVLRAAGSEAQAALEAGSSILRAGSVFAVFPEGTRSRDGRLYKGRGGAAWMALETGATVVPVGLIGTGDMRVFGWLRRGRHRPEVRFGAALDLSDLAGHPGGVARRIATERVMSAIAELTGQERVDEFNATSTDAAAG
jgi:1-acyl-sn-glycerol-3-phosphate acyltransferase